MPTAAPDWAQVKSLFDEALALPAAQRTAFVDAATCSDAVRSELRSLLAHHQDATDGQVFLVGSAARALAEGGDGDAPASVQPGERLGAWEVVRLLGSGGMGEVFEARRADGQFQGRAAVKLLKRGMDSAAVLARFALERQALARLNHPHIARLLDAGASSAGLPYFVMEFIDGEPIDRAVKGQPLEARLLLFLQLADAVAHAHRNLLVHRDLKPGNVLVDSAGEVKLLDFGIAKALDPAVPLGHPLQPGSEGTGRQDTVVGQRPYTPNYASPEQVRGEPVSTATDVYSLGVLLYEMLTGTRPTGRRATTPGEAARSVLEDEPTRPSRLPASIAVDPQWLATRRRLEGDLDNILLKALEKSPERRYASIDALAADVRAFLEARPVSARAAQPLYLLRKFVQRHRAAVATGGVAALGLATALAATLLQGRLAAALGVAVLAIALVAALVQARRAASARDAAARAGDDARAQLERVKRIVNDLIFRYGDTVTHMPGGAQAQEGLLRNVVTLLEPTVQGAADDLDLVATMASVLGRLGEIQGNSLMAARERAGEALATTERALALAERAWEQCKGDWRFASWHIRTLYVRGQLLRARGQLHEARALIGLAATRAAVALALQHSGEGHLYMGTSLANAHLELALLMDHPTLPSFGDGEQALAEHRRAEAALRALLARTDDLAELDRNAPPGEQSSVCYLTHQVGTIIGSRALIHLRANRLTDALAEVEEAMRLRHQNIAREPRNVWWRDGVMCESSTLALCLLHMGRAAEGLQAATLAWDTLHALALDEGAQSKWARPAARGRVGPPYGWALLANGRPHEALEVLEPCLAYWSEQTGAEAPRQQAQLQQHLAAARAALEAVPRP
jgi:serine/threonine protein kinase